jgi:hypothetical protein
MTTQLELRSGWASGLERLIEGARQRTADLAREQIDWQPPEGGWSVGQVLDHLSQTNELYLREIETALTAPVPLRQADPVWKPSFAGALLAKAILNPRKGPAPRVFRPAPRAGPDPIERYEQSVRRLTDALKASGGVDLRRTRIRSPAWRVARFNLGEGFLLNILHAERHFGQIDRVRTHPQFPR